MNILVELIIYDPSSINTSLKGNVKHSIKTS